MMLPTCLLYTSGAALKNLKSQIKFISEAFRANAEFTGEYPAWEYKKDSKLRDDMVRIFEQMYGKKPTIEAIPVSYTHLDVYKRQDSF